MILVQTSFQPGRISEEPKIVELDIQFEDGGYVGNSRIARDTKDRRIANNELGWALFGNL